MDAIGQETNLTRKRLKKWSPSGKQVVTKWSPGGHQVLTKLSLSGHRLVTKWSPGGHKVHGDKEHGFLIVYQF